MSPARSVGARPVHITLVAEGGEIGEGDICNDSEKVAAECKYYFNQLIGEPTHSAQVKF